MAHPELKPVSEIPDLVVVTDRSGARLTPNEIRHLKKETGKTMEEMFGPTADDGDKLQTLAWLNLRRQGVDVSWERCGDIVIEFREEEPDPTSSER